MKRIFFSAATVAAVLGIGVGDARAQALSVVEPNTITVTPFLSGSFGTSNGGDSSLGIGAAIGYDWTRRLGFEFEIGRVFDIAGDTANLDWSLTNFSGNVVVHFDAPRLTPYATAGLGWERSSLGFDDDDPILDLDVPSSTEIAWNFGGGVKVPVNERILARADLRRFQVNDLAPDHWRLYGGLTFWIRR
jgi:opacity protein-like surface antigen